MLRGILYETVTVDGSGVTLRLLPESPVYQGHFPGYPITPGVCLVEMALEAIGEMAGQAGHDVEKSQAGHDENVAPLRLVAAKNIKFTSPVLPSEGMALRFNFSGGRPERGVEVFAGDTLCAKMSLTVE